MNKLLNTKILSTSLGTLQTRAQSDIFTEYLFSLSDIHFTCDLLNFWIEKLTCSWKPIAGIALDYLAILASSSSSERQFYITGETIGLRRLKLSEDHIEDNTIIILNPDIARTIYAQMNQTK